MNSNDVSVSSNDMSDSEQRLMSLSRLLLKITFQRLLKPMLL